MLQVNHREFFDGYRKAFGPLIQDQVDGMNALLHSIETDEAFDEDDVCPVAYLLATVKHECANTWRPIEERGDQAHFDQYECGTRIGIILGNTQPGDGYLFRGRGYPMLTGRYNYTRMGRVLGIDLVGHPDLALSPDTAYDIMAVGMRGGFFTGKELRDFCDGRQSDYEGARVCVNGTDCAQLIAKYATTFEAILISATADDPAVATDLGDGAERRQNSRVPVPLTNEAPRMSWLDIFRDLLKPKPPPTPTTRTVSVTVTGAHVTPTAILSMDSGEDYDGAWDGGPRTFRFTLPSSTPAPFGATVTVRHADIWAEAMRFELAPFVAPYSAQVLPPLDLKIRPVVPVPPVVPPVIPPVVPPVIPPVTTDAIVLSSARVAAPDCPDVRAWPIFTTITKFTLSDHEAFERGDTMVEFAGRDQLPPAMGSQGAIAYTLWMGCHIKGQWHILPIVECIGGYVPTGQLLGHGQLAQNLAYFADAPLHGYSPRAGEDVAFFCTTGDTRRQDVHAPGISPGRTNVIVVKFQPGTVTF